MRGKRRGKIGKEELRERKIKEELGERVNVKGRNNSSYNNK